MTIYELIQELADYPANSEVTCLVTGEKVEATAFGIHEDYDVLVDFEDKKSTEIWTSEKAGKVFLNVNI